MNLAGKARHLSSVRVTLSDWACQTGGSGVTTTNPNSNCLTDAGSHFKTAVTLNIYAPGVAGSSPGETVPGELLKTVTRTFTIPFRPSASNRCSTPAFDDAGGWYDSKTKACYHGLDHDIVFAKIGRITLPNTVVYGIFYNSDNSGPNPIGGTSSPTDSLNVALARREPLRGLSSFMGGYSTPIAAAMPARISTAPCIGRPMSTRQKQTAPKRLSTMWNVVCRRGGPSCSWAQR